ncbi:heavy-metal-associated domain-containing protein [Ktedonospora formicarum]|uniref:Copper chaperone CopZ n=1 Tax=Ktedonospora formicarum TaxID=2778364 RepID=A0A8J3I0G6_9CHLR|nr:cation transporter [Ktedonospora formicarum]GHO44408.1 copper chaperone CopZ [Ktedonospora formicarum]
MKEVTLSVPDMSCEHCVNAINNALKSLDGIEGVNIDLSSKTVAFGYQPEQVTMEKIEAALDDAGYSVADVK